MTLQSELARLLEARGWRIRNLGVRCWQDPLKPDGELLGVTAALGRELGVPSTGQELRHPTVHLCWVDADPDEGTPSHYRPCTPELCEAQHLHNLMVEVVQELKDRRACLVGAQEDLVRIAKAGVQDGGLWIRAVAEARVPLVEAAVTETDKALVALGGFDVCV